MDKNNGYRTRSRTCIQDYLQKNADRTVTVTDIVRYMEEQEQKVNVTTIYRYLDKLIKEGKVHKYVSESKEMASFQWIKECCHDHLHIRCIGCGKVAHLDCGFMNEIEQHFLAHHGFTLDCEGTILHGFCASCKRPDK